MEELKNLELTNETLNNFDKIMSYHLDKVEELTIKDILGNSKFYNLISLCTNLKTLNIDGDLRVDVNKIMFNIFKPELLETLILNSVKFPTGKNFSKFTNLKTISLTNITFSNAYEFLNSIPEKDSVEAINLSNVDLCGNSINICGMFKNLKYLNIDELKNCKFDDFTFLSDSKKIVRFDFYGNTIEISEVKELLRKKYIKNIDVNLKTKQNCQILNRLEINENEVNLTINSSALKDAVSNISFSKINDFTLIIEDKTNISSYMKNIKKVKGDVKVTIKNMSYMKQGLARDFEEILGTKEITVLNYGTDSMRTYSISEYIEIREKLDEIIQKILSKYSTDIDKFEQLYNYFRSNIKYNEEANDMKTFFLSNKSNHNLYAIIMESALKELGIKNKLVSGIAYDEPNLMWNQVKLSDDWFNVDLASELKLKQSKKIWQNISKDKLFDDEVFYKTHIPRLGNPEPCHTQIAQKKKDLKKSPKKIGTFKKIIYKLKNVFNFNQNKTLPSPNDGDKNKD